MVHFKGYILLSLLDRIAVMSGMAQHNNTDERERYHRENGTENHTQCVKGNAAIPEVFLVDYQGVRAYRQAEVNRDSLSTHS